jgi:hypothetical protein
MQKDFAGEFEMNSLSGDNYYSLFPCRRLANNTNYGSPEAASEVKFILVK